MYELKLLNSKNAKKENRKKAWGNVKKIMMAMWSFVKYIVVPGIIALITIYNVEIKQCIDKYIK